ncbi:MAG: WG repeat-containing protein [Faecalibacterium sp.]
MKKTRIAALALLAGICIAGWAILGMTAAGNAKKQENTVAAAQYYRGKKLFQLSIQNYQSALAEKPSEELYDEYLVTCGEYYLDFPTATVRGMEEAAYAAAVDAYPERADYWTGYAGIYYTDGDYDTLISVLDKAKKYIPFDDTLMQYWNEAYYACNVSGARYQAVSPAGMDGVYFGWDGEKSVLFSPVNGELLERDFSFVGPVGESTVVLCSDEKGESFVYQLSTNLMVGRFMAEFEDAKGYGGGVIPVRLKGREDWCYIDLEGTEYFNGYQSAGMFQNGKAAVQYQNGKWALIDQSGTQQGDEYDEIQISENGTWLINGAFLAKRNGVWNFYSEAGEQQNTLNADAVDRNVGNGTAFQKDGKWGFALSDGSVVIAPQYERARSFSQGVAAVYQAGRWGFINTNETLVIDYLLEDAGYFDGNGVCFVKLPDRDALQMLTWRVERK